MRRGFVVIAALIGLVAVFFIPFNRDKTIIVKASFFKVYKQLLAARNWANWQPEIKREFDADSAKVSFISKPDGYSINTPSTTINVRETASNFIIQQQGVSGDHTYSFTVAPHKDARKTVVDVVLKTNLAGYVTGLFSKNPFEKTAISHFKNYLENDSLYYGYRIYKVRVPLADLLVIRKVVPKAKQFAEADSSFADLSRFIAAKKLKKMQPLIAQYIQKGTDSTQVNVGFYINKEIKSTGYITYVKMPKNGPLVVVDYKGRFDQRLKPYAAIKRYFTDHTYQSAILPFETYYDDKLPQSDGDIVNLRINFTSFQ